MSGRVYRLVVEGELGPRYAKAFEEMELVCGQGRTTIVGRLDDQAQLQGVVDRIARLGLTLVSVSSDENAA